MKALIETCEFDSSATKAHFDRAMRRIDIVRYMGTDPAFAEEAKACIATLAIDLWCAMRTFQMHTGRPTLGEKAVDYNEADVLHNKHLDGYCCLACLR